MAKVTVKICMGTTCFIMGGNRLNDIIDVLKNKYKDDIEVEISNCLECCSDSHSKAPFVKINDEIISEVTPEKLFAETEQRING